MGASMQKINRSWWLLAAISAASAGGLAWAFGAGSAAHAATPPQAPRATPVQLAPVTRGPITRQIRASGTLDAARELDLSFKVGGVVLRVTVDEGAHVKKGQPLAIVDPTEVRAGVSQAEQALEKATRDLARVERLHGEQGAPKVLLDDATTALAVARASADSAAFNLRHTVLVAPEDGVIERRMLEVGEIVGPGRPVFHMSSRREGKVVRAALTDRDALSVRLDEVAAVALDARPGASLAGRITRIASAASPGTGTLEVEITLSAQDTAALPSGLTAKVSIPHVEGPVATVPVTALVDGEGERAAVYVVEGGRAKAKEIRVRSIEGDKAIVSEGLDNVDTVVSTGAERIQNGAPVRVVR